MDHVKLVKDFAGYKAGTIFAIVDDRRYWGTVTNVSTPGWVGDGKWIGCFEVGMPKSEFTFYCITKEGYQAYSNAFESVSPTKVVRDIKS